MLNKLIKYDFKWINKVMYVYFILLGLISVAIKIVENMDQSLLLVIVDKILVSMFIGCTISTVITCIMRVWARFINNIYKDESYLTHTLPVTKSQIFNSKIIAGSISLLMSALVIAACIAIVFINKDTIESLKVMYQSLVDVYNGVFAVGMIIGFFILIALEIIYFMMAGILGIVIGHRSNNFKMIKSIVVGIGSYGFLSTMSFIIIYIISTHTEYDIIGNGFPTINYIKVLGILSLVIYLVYDVGYYLIAKRILNKGVNVE